MKTQLLLNKLQGRPLFEQELKWRVLFRNLLLPQHYQEQDVYITFARQAPI